MRLLGLFALVTVVGCTSVINAKLAPPDEVRCTYVREKGKQVGELVCHFTAPVLVEQESFLGK